MRILLLPFFVGWLVLISSPSLTRLWWAKTQPLSVGLSLGVCALVLWSLARQSATPPPPVSPELPTADPAHPSALSSWHLSQLSPHLAARLSEHPTTKQVLLTTTQAKKALEIWQELLENQPTHRQLRLNIELGQTYFSEK
jgi:hypothetical protein